MTAQKANGAVRSRVFGSSVIGPMHLHNEIPCQDACAYAATAANVIVIAVADGLGSAARSDTGANLAVTSALRFCMASLQSGSFEEGVPERIVRSAAAHARQELERLTQEESYNLRDLGCTLIVAVATGQQFAIAHIGDGAVVGKIDGALCLLSSPGESEYTNEVVPITSADWQNSLRVTSGESSVCGIAVFTDGCQRAAFRKAEDSLVPFERFFNPVFDYAHNATDATAGASEIAALLASAKLCEHSDDDKTLVVGVIETD